MAFVGSRGTILNIIKTLLLAVIAFAMVKFAFFPPASADDAQSLDPTGDYGQITTMPQTGTITNAINLQGSIQPDSAATVKATLSGEVTEIYVKDGEVVNAGDTLLLIQKEMQTEPEEYTDEEGNTQMTKPQKYYENAWVTAPAGGKVSLSALVSQIVNVGDTVASVQPPTFSAVANLSPEQMYRIQNLPQKATITIKNGPAPFECLNLQINTPNKPAQPGAQDGQQQTTGIEARCAIAGDQKVFPGLQVTMGLIAGEAKDVLIVPVSAVEGRFESGFVYGPSPEGGEPVKIPVKLGLTDGRFIQIVEGLTADQEILEFVPGQKLEDKMGMGFPGMGPVGLMGPGEEGMDVPVDGSNGEMTPPAE